MPVSARQQLKKESSVRDQLHPDQLTAGSMAERSRHQHRSRQPNRQSRMRQKRLPLRNNRQKKLHPASVRRRRRKVNNAAGRLRTAAAIAGNMEDNMKRILVISIFAVMMLFPACAGADEALSAPVSETTSTTGDCPNGRAGAKCKDGTNSTATGSGACSSHGGVSYWICK